MAEPRKRGSLNLSKSADLGLRMAVALMLGAYAGYKLDQWLRIEPFGLVAGCLLGLALGMVIVIRAVASLQAEDRDDEAP